MLGESGKALLALPVNGKTVLTVESHRKDNTMDCSQFEELRLALSLGVPWTFEGHIWDSHCAYIKTLTWTWVKRAEGAVVSTSTQTGESQFELSALRVQRANSDSSCLRWTRCGKRRNIPKLDGLMITQCTEGVSLNLEFNNASSAG